MTTTVRKWFNHRGFGFLNNPEYPHRNIYVHRHDLRGSAAREGRLLPDEAVRCRVERTSTGLSGREVERLTHAELREIQLNEMANQAGLGTNKEIKP